MNLSHEYLELHLIILLLSYFYVLYIFWAPKALLGNRYGQRALPRLIPEKQFEVLLSKLSKKPEGVKLLQQWFLKDNNAIPPTFVLQPITAHFPQYSDLRPESGPQRDKDLLSWRLTETQLLQLLRSAATEAEAAGDITAEQKQLFYTSGQTAETLHTVCLSIFSKCIQVFCSSRPQSQSESSIRVCAKTKVRLCSSSERFPTRG